MQILRRLVSCGALLLLVACGGGGGGGGAVNNPPPPTFLNTASSFYMPESAGNIWRFSSGGSITDSGSGSLSCSCVADGITMEGMDITTPAGAYNSTLFLAKGNPFGHNDTFLIGISTDHGTSIALVGPSQLGTGEIVPGIGLIDDNPQVNEAWFAGGASSTITAVGGILKIAGGNINNVANDTLSGAGLDNGFSFSRGVGWASVRSGTQVTPLVSFTIGATPHSLVRHGLIRAGSGKADLRVINSLF